MQGIFRPHNVSTKRGSPSHSMAGMMFKLRPENWTGREIAKQPETDLKQRLLNNLLP